MNDKAPKSPLNVDLGAKAEAKLEIKAEVPTTTVGRFVDAVTDVFRPFSERRGLRGDQIRLQREDVLIEIAKKAKQRLEIENKPLNPVPNKFLVPFMEKASLGDPTDTICEMWANLLASAAQAYDAKMLAFVDILS
ncbi:MAG TPA: hypothetical protein VF744_00365 [Beijerinckiaceae bacterium]|jgi:hypothetical protein